VARSAEGKLFSWGGGGCGQLGHPDTNLMPKDEDGCAYLPVPQQIELLKDFVVKEVYFCFDNENIGRCWESAYNSNYRKCWTCLFMGCSRIRPIRTSRYSYFSN